MTMATAGEGGPGEEAPPPSGRVYRSALLAVAMQWSIRLIGLVSVFILARLLSPRDFGIVGIAMATVALVEIFSMIGLRQALLRMKAPEREHLDTAWTLQLLLFSALGLVVAALAPLAAHIYDEPALAAVIAVLATRFLFLGLVNIGIVDFDRNLDFGRDLRMRVGARLLSFAVTVAAAVLLRSYWALVIGLMLQSGLLCLASYLMHPFRPRLSLARRSELLGVSIWMFLNYGAQILHHQVERLVIGRFAAMSLVGLYSVSKDLSSIFTQEIATALNRVTYVTTARTGRPLSEDPGRVAVMLGTYAMISAPMGLGLAATAEAAVAVLLGGQWLAAAPLLQLIAPASALYAVYKLIASSLQASGHERLTALMSGAGALGAAAAIGAAAWAGGGALAVAGTALAVTLTLLASATFVIARIAAVGPLVFTGPIARPFAAAAAMFALLRAAPPATGFVFLDLLLSVALGAAVYAATVFILWFAAGRPAGAEAEAAAMIGKLRERLGSGLQRRRASRRT